MQRRESLRCRPPSQYQSQTGAQRGHEEQSFRFHFEFIVSCCLGPPIVVIGQAIRAEANKSSANVSLDSISVYRLIREVDNEIIFTVAHEYDD